MLQGNPEGCTLQVNCPERRIWHAHAGTYLAETEGIELIATLHGYSLSPTHDILLLNCSQV